jgi:ribosomal protein S10
MFRANIEDRSHRNGAAESAAVVGNKNETSCDIEGEVVGSNKLSKRLTRRLPQGSSDCLSDTFRVRTHIITQVPHNDRKRAQSSRL